MFSQRIPLSDLINFCRMLRHQLSAGLSLVQVMKQQSQHGPRSVRSVADRLSLELGKGSSLADALDKQKSAFPPLFLSLVKLGETTGHLTEVFDELERYYALEVQLRRQFRSQTFLPILQFVAAVFVLAGVIYVLGLIAQMTNSKPLLTLFGLSGGAASLAFLGLVWGSIAAVWIFWLVLRRFSQQNAGVDRVILKLPAVGSCLYALLMSRFTLAMYLTLDTGLSIHKAMRLCLAATGNAYFESRSDAVVSVLKSGESLHEALAASELFADDFLNIVASAEVSGRVPEMMKHQAEHYHEDVTHKMKTLTMLAGMGVWFACAAFIIWAIFKLAFIYINAIGG